MDMMTIRGINIHSDILTLWRDKVVQGHCRESRQRGRRKRHQPYIDGIRRRTEGKEDTVRNRKAQQHKPVDLPYFSDREAKENLGVTNKSNNFVRKNRRIWIICHKKATTNS